MDAHSLFDTSAIQSAAATTAAKGGSRPPDMSPRNLWLVITAAVGLLTVINLGSRALALLRRPKPVDDADSEKRSPEAHVPGSTGKSSVRRLPAAVATGFNILAFRTTIPIGPGAITNVSELTFIVGYLVAMLTILFANSE